MSYNLKLYDLVRELTFTTIDVEFSFDSPISIDGWIGSYIRGGFLEACERVKFEDGTTLRWQLTEKPVVDSSHPWGRGFEGGAPRGFAFKILSHCNYHSRVATLPSHTPILFKIVVIGSVQCYNRPIVNAVKLFARKGVCGVVCSPSIIITPNVKVGEFINDVVARDVVALRFNSPVSLFRKDRNPDLGSHQARMNHMPSLYELSRTAANRLAKLMYLYGEHSGDVTQIEEAISQVELIAIKAELLECTLKRRFVESKIRSNGKGRLPLNGFVGRMVWGRAALPLLPLYSVISHLMLGYDTSYGFGDLAIEAYHNDDV